MDFSGNNTVQGSLPQFSELTARSNTVATSKFTSGDNTQVEQTHVYTTAAGVNLAKQNLLVNSANKYSGPILAWPDPNTLMQLCEKQGIQTINIPNYNQNSPILSVQSNSLPVRIIPNMYLPSTSQPEIIKQDIETRTENEKQSIMTAGILAKPLGRSSEDSMNKIDQRAEVEIIDQDFDIASTLSDIVTQSSGTGTTTSKPGLLAWFLTPLTQNLQINPQTLQNRVTQFKETLSNLGLRNGGEDSKGKQLSNANNLLHLVGVNDSGFYTNRLEPAGFFGGNGWLANKGGILGGPGVILSTGSVLTDYPTAYRRK